MDDLPYKDACGAQGFRARGPFGSAMQERNAMWTQEIAWVGPFEAAERLAALPSLSFLDSAMPHPTLGRYSTLAADPFGTFRVRDGKPYWDEDGLPGEPLAALRAQLARYRTSTSPDLPPFQGGAIGFLSYEFGWSLDRGPSRAPIPSGETVHLAFYDTVVGFDHVQKRCWIMATGWPAATAAARHDRALERMAALKARLDGVRQAIGDPPPCPGRETLDWQADVSRETYRAGIETVKAYIRAGDIYQANIAQRFRAAVPAGADPLALYRRLRDANPAPFAAFLRCGPTTILSSSPERFLRLRGGEVETRPIKGTVRRASDQVRDEALAQTLLHSRKDRAENVMIVDLLRNDLSRVCTPDSVAVSALCELETYAGLHHLVSVVTGRLRDGFDALDLIGATFPGGSITGAPKLRAMEIIAEIEGSPRGPYCGAIGTFGFDGDVDLNIAIRTIVVTGETATMQAGGGITILSDPDLEYEETLTKAHRIFEAFAAQGLPQEGQVLAKEGESAAGGEAPKARPAALV